MWVGVRDGFRVLWTILRDRLDGRRYKALASRLRSVGTSVGKPFWMLANPSTAELEAAAAPDFPAEMQKTLDVAWADHAEVPASIRREVEIAAAEVGNNILEHAGRGRDLRICMEVWVPGDHVRIEFTDDGLPVSLDLDLTAVRMPDVMAENGRGLALARAALAEFSYQRAETGNRWTLVSHGFAGG